MSNKVERRQPALTRERIESIQRRHDECLLDADSGESCVTVLALCEMALASLDQPTDQQRVDWIKENMRLVEQLERLTADRKAVIEECAKVCEQGLDVPPSDAWERGHSSAQRACAAMIRALTQEHTGGNEV